MCLKLHEHFPFIKVWDTRSWFLFMLTLSLLSGTTNVSKLFWGSCPLRVGANWFAAAKLLAVGVCLKLYLVDAKRQAWLMSKSRKTQSQWTLQLYNLAPHVGLSSEMLPSLFIQISLGPSREPQLTFSFVSFCMAIFNTFCGCASINKRSVHCILNTVCSFCSTTCVRRLNGIFLCNALLVLNFHQD